MKKNLFLALFAVAAGLLSAQSFYQEDLAPIDYMSLEQGLPLPFRSFPYHMDEYADSLDRIDPSSLSPAGKAAYAEAAGLLEKDYLYSEQEGFSFNAGFEITAEGFYHWNIDNNYDADETDYLWQHGYEEREPFFEIPLEAEIFDLLYVKLVLLANEEHFTAYSPGYTTASDNNFNIPDFSSPEIDIHFPYEAYTLASGEHWQVKLGRDQLSWGNGITGNLLLSDYSDFYDHLLVSTDWKNFKFTTTYIVMDEYSPVDEGVDKYDGVETLDYYAFIGHRFDVRFFDRLNFAVSEAVTYEGIPFLVRDLNSVYIYHNWETPGKTNCLMNVEFEYVPWKYFYLYGQLAMDELMTGYEEEGDGGGGAGIWGWILGLRGAYPLGPGFLIADFEYAHIDPLLYSRSENPYFYNVRRIWSVVTDSYEFIVKPIGYEYGPDVILLHGEVGYDWPSLLKTTLSLDYLREGSASLLTDYETSADLTTPSGIVENSLIIGLSAESDFHRYWSVGLDFYYIYTENKDNIEGNISRDVEVAGYIRFKI